MCSGEGKATTAVFSEEIISPTIQSPWEKESPKGDNNWPIDSEKDAKIVFDLYLDNLHVMPLQRIHKRLETLQKFLSRTPNDPVLLQGFCDQRETKAYSFVQAQRRTMALKAFINDLSILKVDPETKIMGNITLGCQTVGIECSLGNIRLGNIFSTMSFLEPQGGCLLRLALPKIPQSLEPFFKKTLPIL